MRALCLGDTQIGKGGPGRLADQVDVVNRIAELAIERNVELVLHAGDFLDGPTVTPEHHAAVAGFVAKLREARIPLVAISGNHDQAMRPPTALGVFGHVPGVDVHTVSGVSVLGGVAVACLPWVHPGRVVAARGGGDRELVHDDVEELLLQIASGLRDDCAAQAPDARAVLLAHWSVSGALLPTGLPVDSMRESVLPLVALRDLGFDAIVLGHIHRPQVLAEHPWIGYVGSPQPHDHGEASYPHGVWLLDLSRASASAEFVPLESRRFVTLDIDALEAEAISDRECDLGFWPEQIPDGAIVRLRYTATRDQARRIDGGAVRRALVDAGAHKVTVEPTIIREQRARIAAITEQLTEREALELYIADRAIEERVADGMRIRLDRYVAEVAA